jgi:hypothetical protein
MDLLIELIELLADIPGFHRRFGTAGCALIASAGVLLAVVAIVVAIWILM